MNTLNAFADTPHQIGNAKPLAGLLAFEALLSFAPMLILGPAIGWPASLGRPAAEQLTAIAAAPGAVQMGYAVYLLYSLLIAPVFILLAARLLKGQAGRVSAALLSVCALFALSCLARCIGILRWLTVMPMLATNHATADATGKTQIELIFSAITVYGGGIGELLGVSIFMACALGVLCAAAWRQRSLPAWLTASGLLSSALLLGMALPVLSPMTLRVPVALAVTGLTLWMLAAAVWVWRRA
jgi:Domain of unknown function (DUF4386)